MKYERGAILASFLLAILSISCGSGDVISSPNPAPDSPGTRGLGTPEDGSRPGAAAPAVTPTASPTRVQPPAPTPSPADFVSVQLLNVQFLPEDYDVGRYSEALRFHFRYENESQEDVRAFTGEAIFADIFDRVIKRVALTHDDLVPAGSATEDTDKVLELNQFLDEDERLKNTEFANLRFSFAPSAVLLSDGRLVGSAKGAKLRQEQVSEIQQLLREALMVELVDTTYVPEDYTAGRYSDYVLFTFKYSNTSGQDIRAFTGVVTFMDLFRRPIKELSLTYDTAIAAGGEVVDDDKGLELNQFLDDDQWLATTPRANMVVEFEPQSIIFGDGTRLGSAQ
jgi:hypothetical protein